jgi:16S rRNA (guanine(966)-N(2))-methyltransferase RsmD
MRVIAGTAKGREILAPKGLNTRPTLAKVKEAMFGMIQFDIEDACVLDLFSGSGGLGIEAISRGARRAVFCDSDRQAFSLIRENLKKLGFEDRANVYFGDSIALLDRLPAEGTRFDIALLDPPYKTDLASRALEKLGALRLLNPGAIILVEHSGDNPPQMPEGFEKQKTKKYGDSFVTYAVYEGA